MNKYGIALALSIGLGGCATPKPFSTALLEMPNRKPSVPSNTSDEALGRACAEQMVASAPTPRARNISTSISRGEVTSVVVQAILQDVGIVSSELAVEYQCKYSATRLISGKWTKGL